MSQVLAPFLFLAVSIGLFFTYIDPAYKALQALREQDTKLEEVLAKTKELRERKQGLLGQLDAISKENRAKLNMVLPDSIDTVRLVLDIDTLASKYDIRISGFNTVNGQMPTRASTISPSSSSYADLLGTMPLTFTLEAPYDNFKKFLGDIQKSVRLINVVGVNVDPNQSDDAKDYTYTVGIETFWLKPNEEITSDSMQG